MSRSPRVRPSAFQLVTQVAKVDSRHRIALGRAGSAGSGFTIYRNDRGQVLLDPVEAAVPPSSILVATDSLLTADRLSLAEEHHEIGCFGPDSLAD